MNSWNVGASAPVENYPALYDILVSSVTGGRDKNFLCPGFVPSGAVVDDGKLFFPSTARVRNGFETLWKWYITISPSGDIIPEYTNSMIEVHPKCSLLVLSNRTTVPPSMEIEGLYGMQNRAYREVACYTEGSMQILDKIPSKLPDGVEIRKTPLSKNATDEIITEFMNRVRSGSIMLIGMNRLNNNETIY